MISYNVGCNFDDRLLEGVSSLNCERRDARITEFYGAIRDHAWLSARPAYRLPQITLQELGAFISRAREAGLGFNYSLNTIYPGTKRELAAKMGAARDVVKAVVDIGVSRITVATPLAAGIVRSVSSAVGLEVSTIAHIDTITQIKIWRDHYGITSVCGSLLKNRSIAFLERAAGYCLRNGIRYEVMANEFCGTGTMEDGSAATHCIYRDSCYLGHAANETLEDDLLLDRYPMERCMRSRRTPAVWLKTHFIRPEDVIKYRAIGIDTFKLTGRTGSTQYLLMVAQAYMRQQWHGNLLGLWKSLETIGSGDRQEGFQPSCYINNGDLDGFVDRWFDDPRHECANEVCGETCCYCDNFAQKLQGKPPVPRE